MGFFDFLKKEKTEDYPLPELLVDMHSHLIPGIDDGAISIEDSISMIREFSELGYKKLITTPHIMGDFYKNTPEIILSRLEKVKDRVNSEGIEIEIDAAAEYYLDEWFMKKVDEKDVLTFGNNYLLIETSYINEPSQLDEVLFQVKASGYQPILAHPERYTYMYSNFQRYKDIYATGVLFQLNLNSISGYYSKAAQDIAGKLIDNNMINFVGSDCHAMKHLTSMKKSRDTKTYRKLMQLDILNNSLLA